MTDAVLTSEAGSYNRSIGELACPTPSLPTMDPHAMVIRYWNGTPIARRASDGYIKATALCKANGKQWNDYWRTDRATTYLKALSAEEVISLVDQSIGLFERLGSQLGGS